VPFCLSKIFY